jgi:hypothetical protein
MRCAVCVLCSDEDSFLLVDGLLVPVHRYRPVDTGRGNGTVPTGAVEATGNTGAVLVPVLYHTVEAIVPVPVPGRGYR